MLELGGTKVEVGVQTTYERINREMHRDHDAKASIDANRRLRNAGFKVGFHMMPGQPGMSKEMCLEDFRRLFEQEQWKPDYLKIYPTLIVRGTATYDWWHKGEFDPLDNEEAADLVAEIKDMIPRYTRLQRVQRDIPADYIDAGVWKSNLRQLARKRMDEHGWSCDCIRCREAGMNDETPENVELDVMSYDACGGTEQFLSFEDFEKDLLVGFCRLRFPNDGGTAGGSPSAATGDRIRPELENAAIVRELHVYGSEVAMGDEGETDQHQHKGYGRRLMNRAEELAADAGYDKLSVISGIGAREYYRNKLGYTQDGPYVSKRL
jgi:elongator complex protein 3